MRKNLNIFIPVVLAILLGSLSFIFAQAGEDVASRPVHGKKGEFAPPRPPPGHRGGFGPHIFDHLDLTDTQKEQVRAMEFASHEASKEYFAKVRAADDQLRMMVESGNYTETQARPVLKDKAKAMTELELIRLGTEAAIQKLLTAEQRRS